MRAAASSFVVLCLSAIAAASPWEFRPSVAARLGYDDNVFLQDKASFLPGVAGAVPAEAGSWVARASVSLEAAWKPSAAFQLDVAYSPEIVRYRSFPSENHDNHRLDLHSHGRHEDWRYQVKTNLAFVDGSHTSPVFGQAGGGPAIGGVGVRSRREQLNTKLSAHIARDFAENWLRVGVDGTVNDYRTHHRGTATVPGYSNYVDRAEWSSCIDFGRRVSRDLSLVVGVRRGFQKQDDLLGVAHNYDNTFMRFLAGVEGKPRDDLVMRLVAGPDVRRYGDHVAAGYDRSRTASYAEVSATWTPSAADTITLTGKDYVWLSAGGPCAYRHTTGAMRWKRALSSEWSVTAGAAVEVGDSRDYAPAPPGRDDRIYTGSCGVTRSFGKRAQIDFELVREWSESSIVNTPGREYSRWFASVGMRVAY